MREDITQQIVRLEEARKHVLADASHYSAIVPGILPIVGPPASLEVQRWGTEFLAESFASPVLSMHAKEALSVQVLETLKAYLEDPANDEYVVKSVIQTAASIYGLTFRHITNNPAKAQVWTHMQAIKSNILRRFDTGPAGVRIACIKFVQRVVLVQTPGVITDPRRPDQNEISLALVPRDHPLLPPPHLEAEATGLLDRLLNVFYEKESDAILIDATLNCLSLLVKSRQSISSRIINVVLAFNPFKDAHAGLSTKEKVLLRSMEKTVKAFLLNINPRQEAGPFASKIRQLFSRFEAARLELSEQPKKRGPPELDERLDNTKKARLADEAPPLPPGPVSLAQFYTLTNDTALALFDVTALPHHLVMEICLSALRRIDPSPYEHALNALRKRYLDISQQASIPGPPLIPVDMEEDEYEPDFDPAEPREDEEQRGNYTPPPPETPVIEQEMALRAFKLPPPQPLSIEEKQAWGRYSIGRVFDLARGSTQLSRSSKGGLNRLAGSNRDGETWLTIMIRLATRADLDSRDDLSEEKLDTKAVIQRAKESSLADGIRETLWKYIVEDFRHRIDIAISWLNEEWYNERLRVMKRSSGNGSSSNMIRLPTYEKWVIKLLDAIIPYLDANDKILIRFLGEIPEVGQLVLERVKNMARDPDRVLLTVRAIYYLVAFKPPAKEMAADALEDLWINYEEAKAAVKPYLAKVRPNAITTSTVSIKQEESTPLALMPKAEKSPASVAAAG